MAIKPWRTLYAADDGQGILSDTVRLTRMYASCVQKHVRHVHSFTCLSESPQREETIHLISFYMELNECLLISKLHGFTVSLSGWPGFTLAQEMQTGHDGTLARNSTNHTERRDHPAMCCSEQCRRGASMGHQQQGRCSLPTGSDLTDACGKCGCVISHSGGQQACGFIIYKG